MSIREDAKIVAENFIVTLTLNHITLATSSAFMIRIRVSGEELRRQRIRRIGDAIVHGALDVVKEVFDCMPVDCARVGSKGSELTNSVSDIWTSSAREILQRSNSATIVH
jgi:hypothetical protein